MRANSGAFSYQQKRPVFLHKEVKIIPRRNGERQTQEREHHCKSEEGLEESLGGDSEGEWVYFSEFMSIW